LRANVKALCNHLINPRVQLDLANLAYTLSERRTRFWHRAFITTHNNDLDEGSFTLGKKSAQAPNIRFGFVFTGQGAQWSQMGKDLLEFFPSTMIILEELDGVLQSLPDPPNWSLMRELVDSRTSEHLRQPEFSQPLVTALQICILAVLDSWGVHPVGVVGHSSGEIAAAYAAGLLDRAGAIKAAFYRGRAALSSKNESNGDVGMLAVGLGADDVAPFLEPYAEHAWIACFNSPSSLTISGNISALETLASNIKKAGHFARLLQVDLAYHSKLMEEIGQGYEQLLNDNFQPLQTPPSKQIHLYSSVSGSELDRPFDAGYWKSNMVSPVRFDQALRTMLEGESVPDILIEIGPSGALAGPIAQTLKTIPAGDSVSYCASWARGSNAGKTLFDVAGRLFTAGFPIDLGVVNRYEKESVHTIVDLPNYVWNHSIKYWHESPASKDWRFKKFVIHDLLGSKILGSSWRAPTWRKLISLDDVRWLRDHRMGSDILMPGAGFLTFAIEAKFQQYVALGSEPMPTVKAANDLCYHLRNVRIRKALVLEDGKEADVMISLSQAPGMPGWQEFRINSNTDNVYQEHCVGLIQVQDPVVDVANNGPPAPLDLPTSARPWYKAQDAIGLHFGPAFQKLLQVESTSGQRRSRSTISLSEPAAHYSPQSYYPIHPTAFDGCFQAATPAMFAGERSLLKDVLVPTLIDDLIVNAVPRTLNEGTGVATAEYSGRGRLDEIKNYAADCTVYDNNTGAMIMRLRGLHYSKLGVGEGPDPHTFACVTWKPDVAFLKTQVQMSRLVPDPATTKPDLVMDLISHKSPTLKVLELILSATDATSVWFGTEHVSSSSRWAYEKYDLASIDANSLSEAQSMYESKRDTSFLLADLTKDDFGLASDTLYDLVIVKAPRSIVKTADVLIPRLSQLLSEDAYMLLVQTDFERGSEDNIRDQVTANSVASLSGSSSSPSPRSESLAGSSTPPSSASSILEELDANDEEVQGWEKTLCKSLGLLSVGDFDSKTKAYLRHPESKNSITSRRIIIASLSEISLASSIESHLALLGWEVQRETYPFSDLQPGIPVLVLDELTTSILTTVNHQQWEGVKTLANSGNPILWVTEGAQYHIKNPDRALVHGLFRVARRENGNAKLTTLDVEYCSSPITTWAIDQVLRECAKQSANRLSPRENEYVERSGVLHVHRIIPDVATNAFKRAERDGADIVERLLHEDKSANRRGAALQLQADRLGTFDKLVWSEAAREELPIREGNIEIEIIASGVNFKDVATILGIIPEDESRLGCECSGIVTRVGGGATKFAVGDRVCALAQGSYANRLQVSAQRAHVIPDGMTFQDSATLPLVFSTSVYALFHLANLRQGQSVLIHSGASGVGIACIQLAQYQKADVYVTAGTKEKREYLAKKFNLHSGRIFSSRSVAFAEEVKQATGGRGVDVIVNSLTGELLDASWRLCANGGTFVEIGKRDILDRNALSMEPFGRNCSFRALDLSFTASVSNELIARFVIRMTFTFCYCFRLIF
jgi:acyl transferase domain-containing protein/NADPH:quinone reductase-like Zn-dependent oxidoreductase